MQRLRGIGVSPGVGVGRAVVLMQRRQVLRFSIPPSGVQTELALRAEELGHQAIGLGHRVSVDCLHILPTVGTRGEVNRLLRRRDVFFFEKLLVEENVSFERSLIAVARVAAADREEKIAGRDGRSQQDAKQAGG